MCRKILDLRDILEFDRERKNRCLNLPKRSFFLLSMSLNSFRSLNAG